MGCAVIRILQKREGELSDRGKMENFGNFFPKVCPLNYHKIPYVEVFGKCTMCTKNRPNFVQCAELKIF